MLTTLLLKTLLEVEQSVGRAEPAQIRKTLMEAERLLLGIEAEQIALLTEIRGLREQNQAPPPRPLRICTTPLAASASAVKKI